MSNPILPAKVFKPRFRPGGEIPVAVAPMKLEPGGVERVLRQKQTPALLSGQSPFDQRQIQIRVAAVKLVTDNGMAEVREVNADLMLAAGARDEAQEGKWKMVDGGWSCGRARHSVRAIL